MSIALQVRVSNLEAQVKDFVQKSDVDVLAFVKAAEDRIAKLEGEIRAMKARMGKKDNG